MLQEIITKACKSTLIGIGVVSLLTTAVGANETVSLPIKEKREDSNPELPKFLVTTDARLYQKIFKSQKKGQWQVADRLIEQLDDTLLKGHVFYQRYMHPTKYRSNYLELKNWMNAYADHPGAERVYRLAMRRKPGNWLSPKQPIKRATATQPQIAKKKAAVTVAANKKRLGTRKQRRFSFYVIKQVKSLVRQGRPTQALNRLKQKNIGRRFSPILYDQALAIIARGYYHAKLDLRALKTAAPAIARSGSDAPMALWWSGLSAWRLGKYSLSAKHFKQLAQAKSQDKWVSAGAAFWSARAFLAAQIPSQVNPMLEIAARYSRTFYGMLARRALGEYPVFEWHIPKVEKVGLDLLSKTPATKRALALIQVGEIARAELELRRAAEYMSPELTRVILSLTANVNLPALAFRLGHLTERRTGYSYDAALYPVPNWVPEFGYRIDRAMIFALIRQESCFKERAKSRAGARGLMQLMPSTARFIAKRKHSRFKALHALFDPEYNISLGQQYLEHLLQTPGIQGNLLYTLVAFNGGPGNLSKWRRKSEFQNDPLLFIESIPSRETRGFIERVFTNLWIYRYRLEQAAPSLDAIAMGTWPMYNRLDKPLEKVTYRAN